MKFFLKRLALKLQEPSSKAGVLAFFSFIGFQVKEPWGTIIAGFLSFAAMCYLVLMEDATGKPVTTDRPDDTAGSAGGVVKPGLPQVQGDDIPRHTVTD